MEEKNLNNSNTTGKEEKEKLLLGGFVIFYVFYDTFSILMTLSSLLRILEC
jgi:hypothetical protein